MGDYLWVRLEGAILYTRSIMFKRNLKAGLLLSVAATIAVSTYATDHQTHRCAECGCKHGQKKLVRKVEYEPRLITEQRTKSRVVYNEVEREEEYTVFKMVPKDRVIKEDCWYLEDEVKQKEIEKKKCQIVQLDVDSERNVLIPVTEVTCKMCGCKPCVCSKTYLAPSVKMEEKKQGAVIFPTVKKLVDYCVKTPKKHTIEKAKETVMTLQPVTQKRTVKVCVPEIVKDVVEVQVWKQVEREYWVCEECCDPL